MCCDATMAIPIMASAACCARLLRRAITPAKLAGNSQPCVAPLCSSSGSGGPPGGFSGLLGLIKLAGLLFQHRSLLWGHLRKVINQTKTVRRRVLKTRGHVNALSRTGEGAQITVAALRHIDVKLLDMQTLFMPSAGFLDILRHCLDRLNRDALHRTGALALDTPDTVIHIHKQLHAGIRRQLPALLRILQ